MEMEKRDLINVELTVTEVKENEDLIIEGYGIKWNTLSSPIKTKKQGIVREVVMKGAFEEDLSSEDKIVYLLGQHDISNILGRTDNGSLEVYEDDVGLKLRAILPNTDYGKDIYTLVKDGYIKNMSIGFSVVSNGDEYETRRNKHSGEVIKFRIIKQAKLHEVSLVTIPAYKSSEVSVRSDETIFNEDELINVENELNIRKRKKELMLFKLTL